MFLSTLSFEEYGIPNHDKTIMYIWNLKVYIHGISYMITFIVMHNSVVILSILCLLEIYGYETPKLPMIGAIILMFKEMEK